ncbi:hypothetical protein Tco_1505763 [Tanacetum coccineum]
MKEDESIDSFTGKLMSIITKAATCGLTFDEQTKVRKVLNAVPDKFLPIVATIEMIVDFKTVKLEEIVGKLKTYEERIKFRKGSQEDNSEKLLFTRLGNYKEEAEEDSQEIVRMKIVMTEEEETLDCPKPDRRREISNLVEEDLEPTLLMVTSLEEEPARNGNGIERDKIPKEKLGGIRSEIEIELQRQLENLEKLKH